MRATDIDITGNRKTGFVISEKKNSSDIHLLVHLPQLERLVLQASLAEI